MGTPRGLTLADILTDAEAAGKQATEQAVTASNQRSLSLKDMFDEPSAKPKAPEPFEGGSTLKVTVPLPGEWPEVDTGIPLGKGTAQALAGAGKRLVDVQNRLKQGMHKGSSGALYPGIQKTIDERAEDDKPLLATTHGMLGYALPDIAASTAFPAGSIAKAGIVGGAQGLLNPVTSDDANGTAINAGLGILGGSAGQLVGNTVSNAAGKALHAAPAAIPEVLRTWVAKQGVRLPEAKWADPEARRLYMLAKSKGVPTTIGDIDPTSEWASVENANRSFWTGRRGDMQKQQDATRRVIEDLRKQLSSNNPGADGANIAQGVRDQYKINKDIASGLFKDVSDVAGRSSGLTPVKPLQTYDASRAAIADYPSLFDEFKDNGQVRKLLGLADDTGPQLGMILNPATSNSIAKMTPFKYDQEFGFDDAQFLRKRLGGWYDKLRTQAEKGSLPSGIDGEAVKHAAQIYSAFNRDLDAWGNQAGNKALNDTWKNARGYFRDNVMPFRDPDALISKSPLLRNIVNDHVDTATIANKALPASETSIPADIMAHTTPAGQTAMKSALIHKMTDRSVNPDIQGLGNTGMLRDTTKQAHAGDVVFNKAEQRAVQDARDIAGLTRRSAEAGTTPPPTGARTLPFMAGTTAAASIPAAYYSLGLLGEDIDPSTRIGLSLAAPLAVLGAMKGSNSYARSALGQNLHFADPALGGVTGALQEIAKRAARGAGEPTVNAYVRGSLGHRED